MAKNDQVAAVTGGSPIGLAQAVAGLRQELAAAARASVGDDLRFSVGDVVIEFALEISADAEAHAGVNFWVVDVGGKGSVGSKATHRVTLTLSPETSDGRRPQISDSE